jgi:hypothetical protein
MAAFGNNSVGLFKKLIVTFEKNVNIFPEKWQKSQKIMIITSTPKKQS